MFEIASILSLLVISKGDLLLLVLDQIENWELQMNKSEHPLLARQNAPSLQEICLCLHIVQICVAR